MRSQRGQATADYVAIVAVVGTLLLTGAVVASPDLGGTIRHHLKLALCIVGGDVCRSSDAAAAGLDPCVVSAQSGSRRTGLTIMFLRSGEESGLQIERRSDGSIVITAARGKDLEGSGSVGVSLGEGGELSGSGTAGLRWRSGRTWELPDEAAFRRLLRRLGPRAKPEAVILALEHIAPTARFFEGGTVLSGSATANLLGESLRAADGTAGGTLGRRISADGTTWYLEASAIGPRLLGHSAGGARAWTVEVTERDGAARSLVLRGHRGSEEITARLRLSGGRLLVAGPVERHVYRETDVPGGRDWSASVGVFGFDHTVSARRRELVEAAVYGADGSVAVRRDCLGLGT